VALQVVLPGIKSLIDSLRGWDAEERAARVVATAMDVLAYCAAEPAGTPPSFRVFTNTRRRALRAAIRDRSEPLILVDDFARFEHTDGPEVTNADERQRLEELVDWARERGRLRDETARLVVLTRVGGVSVDDLAAMRDVHPQTLRQQRLRAEQRLRRILTLAR
jgi:DNA-directed RNA polymerase specialized sigma24 family protein